MRTLFAISCAAAILLGCSNGPKIRTDLDAQKAKVEKARISLKTAENKLTQMRDSLEIKVKVNVALGMAVKQATEAEQAILKGQQALVDAERKNLKLQEEYLALLKKQVDRF